MNRVFNRRLAGRAILVLAAAIALAAPGCGPSKGSVTGVVKLNGQPLPSGTINFLSQADQQVVTTDINDGKYSIPSIVPGTAKVTVITTAPSVGGTPPNGGTPIQGPNTPPPVAPGKYVPIPAKYGNPDTSGLSYEVKAGAQTKDFDLTSP